MFKFPTKKSVNKNITLLYIPKSTIVLNHGEAQQKVILTKSIYYKSD